MLRIKFEIVPFGDSTHKRCRTIGTLNVGLQDANPETGVGDYRSHMVTDGFCKPPNPLVQIKGHVRQHGAFALAERLLGEHLNVDSKCILEDEDGEILKAMQERNELWTQM